MVWTALRLRATVSESTHIKNLKTLKDTLSSAMQAMWAEGLGPKMWLERKVDHGESLVWSLPGERSQRVVVPAP